MKIVAIPIVMAGLAMGFAPSADAQYPSSPSPAPVARPDNPRPSPPTAGPVVIKLGETTKTITPDLHGAANIEHGDVEVNVSKNALAAALWGWLCARLYRLSCQRYRDRPPRARIQHRPSGPEKSLRDALNGR